MEAYRERCEDRVGVFETKDRTVIVVADGAGGMGAGDIAAQAVVDEIEREHQQVHSAEEWKTLLKQIDCRIDAGESTAVVLDMRPYGIAGASVGDSQAWIIQNDGTMLDLTKHQNRKPLLGSGNATPVSFTNSMLEGVLLTATDGFWNYAKRTDVPTTIHRTDFYAIPRTCVEMVRLPSGELWDDLGVIATRVAPKRTARKRYEI